MFHVGGQTLNLKLETLNFDYRNGLRLIEYVSIYVGKGPGSISGPADTF